MATSGHGGPRRFWTKSQARGPPSGGARRQVAQILHPNPPGPAANRGWSEAVDRTLVALGLLTGEDGAG